MGSGHSLWHLLNSMTGIIGDVDAFTIQLHSNKINIITSHVSFCKWSITSSCYAVLCLLLLCIKMRSGLWF